MKKLTTTCIATAFLFTLSETGIAQVPLSKWGKTAKVPYAMLAQLKWDSTAQKYIRPSEEEEIEVLANIDSLSKTQLDNFDIDYQKYGELVGMDTLFSGGPKSGQYVIWRKTVFQHIKDGRFYIIPPEMKITEQIIPEKL